VEADPALAGNEKARLRHRCHEALRGLVQLVSSLAVEHVGVKDLQLALGQELTPMPEVPVGEMAVVAAPGELEALPEIHHVDEVLDRVLGAKKAEVDQPLAPERPFAGTSRTG
jgi:hypothetical protein